MDPRQIAKKMQQMSGKEAYYYKEDGKGNVECHRASDDSIHTASPLPRDHNGAPVKLFEEYNAVALKDLPGFLDPNDENCPRVLNACPAGQHFRIQFTPAGAWPTLNTSAELDWSHNLKQGVDWELIP